MTKLIQIYAIVFDYRRFAADILAARLETGMTVREVSELVGCSGSMISRYEQGKEANPHMQNFLKLCNAYDLNPVTYFMLAD